MVLAKDFLWILPYGTYSIVDKIKGNSKAKRTELDAKSFQNYTSIYFLSNLIALASVVVLILGKEKLPVWFNYGVAAVYLYIFGAISAGVCLFLSQQFMIQKADEKTNWLSYLPFLNYLSTACFGIATFTLTIGILFARFF
ncbi:hypothetical protein KFE96_11170 [Kordiimonas sp. SCSIO 12603]|uniref:hypothetical protein n=1 Tax=Kordiimonas sp. SCSIO 12603 TaxID=2829596 RepID=UPI002103A433|nr:hypothetical protein [Kordiimonas sp. SCSIO 12603]UTW57411.1 hypothetical protein KFE96_11170 [Kordiimonas sp. SCSIO 12603]